MKTQNSNDPDGWYDEQRLERNTSKYYVWPGIDYVDLVKKTAMDLCKLGPEVLSDSRKRIYSDCRRLMMMGYEKMGYHESEVAVFVGRDRTSIIAGLKEARVLMECDLDFRIKVEKMYFKIKTIQKIRAENGDTDLRMVGNGSNYPCHGINS